MKYLYLLVLFIFGFIFSYSQNIKQFKNSKEIEIITKSDTINIDNSKMIKLILKQLKNINYYILNDPQNWFRLSDWQIKLKFDSTKEIFIFYSGGYITIGEISFFTSSNEIGDFKEILKFNNNKKNDE